MDYVYPCLKDLKSHIDATTSLRNKSFTVYGPDEFLGATARLSLPAIGVVYEGFRGNPEGEQKKGILGHMLFAVYFVVAQKAAGRTTVDLEELYGYMAELRTQIVARKAPTNRFWEFVIETPVDMSEDYMVYVQRWQNIAAIG